MDKLKRFSKSLDKFTTVLLTITGAIYALGAILWLIAKVLGK